MLPGVYITDSDGNIGMVRSSVEDVCGMIFDISKQSAFSYEHLNEVMELTKPADLETYGITAADSDSPLLAGIPYYHIDQFFTRRGGTGRLFVLFTDCSKNWDALETIQRYAHGIIYQLGIWTEQELWNLNDEESPSYSINIVGKINSAAYKVANTMHTPMAVLLYPNVSKVGLGSGVSEANAVPVFNKIPDLRGDNRYVSVMLGESNASEVLAMQDKLESKTPVGAMGVDLGTLSRVSVPTCIGYVGGCDYSDFIPGIVFGFGANKTKYESVPVTTLSDLNDKAYNFFMKYEGDEVGVYRNFDHTCTDGDYRTVARNRTIGKVRRGVRAALLPKVNKTVLIDPATGHMQAAARTDFINAVTTVLDAMVTAGEISGYTVPVITETASLLQTDSVYISFSVVPVGIASAIYVTEGLSLTA